MSGPLQVIAADETGTIRVRPATVSLDEVADLVHDWEAAQAHLAELWDNRTGSGPDLVKAEEKARKAADIFLESLTVRLTPNEARAASDVLFTASLAVIHRVRPGDFCDDTCTTDCGHCKGHAKAEETPVELWAGGPR